jgi:hypothetical protein
MQKKTLMLCALALTLVVAGSAPAETLQDKPAAPKAGAEAMPPMPKPGPEHQLLKDDVGTWDAMVEMLEGPPSPPSKGVEINTLLGGLWLVSDFKSDMMGMAFQGHGTSGWDPARKKYVGTWVDSMAWGIHNLEGTYNPATKTLTSVMEGPDATGKMTKMRTTSVWTGKDTRVFTMYATGKDGKEAPTMRIKYTRRK